MRNIKIAVLAAVSIVASSCGLERILANLENLKDPLNIPGLSFDKSNPWDQDQPFSGDNHWSGDSEENESATGKAPKGPSNPPAGEKDAPRPRPINEGNFILTHPNGVRVHKKNGLQVTEMPNGIKFYVPDEL